MHFLLEQKESVKIEEIPGAFISCRSKLFLEFSWTLSLLQRCLQTRVSRCRSLPFILKYFSSFYLPRFSFYINVDKLGFCTSVHNRPTNHQQYLHFSSCNPHPPNSTYLSPRSSMAGASATNPVTSPASPLISPLVIFPLHQCQIHCYPSAHATQNHTHLPLIHHLPARSSFFEAHPLISLHTCNLLPCPSSVIFRHPSNFPQLLDRTRLVFLSPHPTPAPFLARDPAVKPALYTPAASPSLALSLSSPMPLPPQQPHLATHLHLVRCLLRGGN